MKANSAEKTSVKSADFLAKQLEKQEKREHKLNSLKNEFEAGKIKNFKHVFAIFNRSPLADELGIPFYTFKKKVSNPGEFTINELIRFAKLIDVDTQTIFAFVLDQINMKVKKR